MTYEELLIQNNHLHIKEMDLSGIDGLKGLCIDGNLAVDNSLDNIEKACVLAEELGHYYTTYGNILDQSDAGNRKQEQIARTWAYNKMIGLSGIISCYEHGCRNRYEMAEHLEVTESFLQEALDTYKKKYGFYTKIHGYVIYFEPLAILKIC